MAKCIAQTKTGARCRNNAIPGTDYCYIGSHGEEHKPVAARLRNWIVNNWLGAAGLLIRLLFGIVTLVGFLWYRQDRRQQATSGLMKPVSSAYPRYVAVGGVLFEIHTPNGTLLRDGDDPLVSVRIADGRMLVSAKLKNERGDLVAEMKDNEWTHQARRAIFDRNYNDNVLEIKDVSGRVALQVADFGEAVELAGVFHCSKDLWTYVLGPADDGGAIIEARPP